MIRIQLLCKQSSFQSDIEIFFQKENIDYQRQVQHHCADIYFIEIDKQSDLQMIHNLKKTKETLIYVIGPKDFDMVNECLRLNVHLYFLKDQFAVDLLSHRLDILQHIQERFQYYDYQRHGMISRIRLSQIFYVESLRHQIIIHSINGTFVERKNLSLFLKDIQSSQFIQVHKSYVVNKNYVQNINNQEIVLKDKTKLPVGRSYKNIIME